MIEAIEQAGGSPIYIETTAGHGEWDSVYSDPDGELYSWMFDGVDPPLATLTYNPTSGDVKIDADLAPGGVITSFVLSSSLSSFTLQPTMTVDGVTVHHGDVRFAITAAGEVAAVHRGDLVTRPIDIDRTLS